MDLFDISAISGSCPANQLSTVNFSAISELPDGNDVSCSNLSISQAAELSLRLTSSERNLKQFRIETERQLSHLKADVHDKDEKVSRLEMQLTETSTRADALLQSLTEDLQRLSEQKKAVESEKMKFMQLNVDLSVDLDRKRNELANVKMQLSLAEDKANRSASNANRQLAEYRLLHGKYNMTKKRLLEAAKLKARVEALESENDRLQQEGQAKMRLSSDLQRLNEMERENSRLKNELGVIRHHNENVDVLREKVSHLSSTLDAAKADLARLSSVETENGFLKEKLRFLGVIGDASGTNNLSSIDMLSGLSEKIRVLEAAAKVDAGEIASLRDSLSVHRDAKKRLTEELGLSKERVAQLERQKIKESDALSQSRSQLALCSSERDSFRTLLQMVERHLGFSGSPLSAQMAAHFKVPTQMKELEAAFESHRAEVTRIRNELLFAKRKNENFDEEMAKAKEELATVKSALEAKIAETAVLQFEHDRYREMLEACNGAPPNLDEEETPQRGTILHLRHNPADDSFRDWLTDEALNLEQQRRAERARHLSGGLVSTESTAMAVDIVSSAEAEDLRRRLDAVERALERKEKDLKATREMAAFGLKELHSAVTHLLGYELNLNAADKIYSLRSTYGEPTEMFLFKPRHHQKTNTLTFQLLETEMARRFKESYQLYVVQHQSIPAFLASVTTDLFSKQTLIA